MSKQTVVLVTGVSSGIGRMTAAKFAAQGCRVFGSVRNLSGAKPIAQVTLVEMDTRDAGSVQLAVESVVAQAKRIDVLVNNAGVSMIGAVEETAVAEAQALFDVNVFGLMRTIQAVLPYMRAQGVGRIVNVSSVLGFLPAPYMGAYAASKHAVEGLSETLDHEVRHFGIRVVLVEPAYTKTSLDINAPHAAAKLAAYDRDRDAVARAIAGHVDGAPDPTAVAATIYAAATGTWQMRRTPPGQASLLPKLRRFLPAGAVDAAIRKGVNLAAKPA